MAMCRTRKIVAEFVAVFLVGALAGGLVTWSYTDTQASTFLSRAADVVGQQRADQLGRLTDRASHLAG